MKYIISLLISISLLFPYTALSYSYNVKNWEMKAKNPEAQLVDVALITGLIIGGVSIVVALATIMYCSMFEDDCLGDDKKTLKTSLILACQKTGNEIESCINQVNQMKNRDLNKIREVIEVLQELPPNVREEILLRVQHATT